MIEPAIAAALLGGVGSLTGAVWSLLREKASDRKAGRKAITLTVGDGATISLDAADFSSDDLRALLEAMEDAKQSHDFRHQDQKGD